MRYSCTIGKVGRSVVVQCLSQNIKHHRLKSNLYSRVLSNKKKKLEQIWETQRYVDAVNIQMTK